MSRMKYFVLSGASAIALASAAMAQDAGEASDRAEEDALRQDTVVVTGVRAALESAVATKRRAPTVVDGISADDIGNFPDLNLAESLQRVTGIQIDVSGNEDASRAGRIAIRGLPVDYSITTLNGQTIGAPRPDLGFSFGNIESSVVSAVDVFKAPIASMDAGGLSGTVDIRTKRALDLNDNFFQVSGKLLYETLAEDVLPAYSLSGGYISDNEKWGVTGSLSVAQQDFRSDVLRVNTYASEDTNGDGVDDLYTPSQIRIANTDVDTDRTSATIGFDFEPTESLRFGLSGLYVSDEQERQTAMSRVQNADRTALETVSSGQFGDTVTRVIFDDPRVRNQGRRVETEYTTESLTGDVEWSQGDWNVSGALHYAKASFDSVGYIARRRQETGSGISLLIDTGAGNVDNFIFQEQNGLFEQASTFAYTGCSADEITAGLTESQCVSSRETGTDWYVSYSSGFEYDASDTTTSAQIDFARSFDGSFISRVDFGGKLRNQEQEFIRPEWALPNTEYDYTQIDNLGSLTTLDDAVQGQGFFGGDLGDQIDSFYFQSEGATFDALTAGQTLSGPLLGGLPAVTGDSLSTFSDATRDITALYVMAELDGSELPFALPLRGNAGVRYVDTSRDVQAYRFNNDVPELIEASTEFSHVLPSVNLIWDLREDLVLRTSYSEAIFRPHFFDFTAAQSVNIAGDPAAPDSIVVELGNPDLEPFESEAIDLSLEWYHSAGNAISLAYFNKEVSNGFDTVEVCPGDISEITALEGSGVGDAVTGALALNASGVCEDQAGVPVSITESVNTDDSFTIEGFEFSVLQSLDFLDTPIIQDTGFQFNYTYIDTSEGPGFDASGNQLPLAGVSENTFNLIAFYEVDEYSLRLAYTSRSEYFEETFGTAGGDDRFIDKQERLDLQATYNPEFAENLFLTLEAFNLTDEQYYAYQGATNRPREYREGGQTYSLQVSYRF